MKNQPQALVIGPLPPDDEKPMNKEHADAGAVWYERPLIQLVGGTTSGGIFETFIADRSFAWFDGL